MIESDEARNDARATVVNIWLDNSPLLPPMAIMVSRAEQAWIDRLRAGQTR